MLNSTVRSDVQGKTRCTALKINIQILRNIQLKKLI